MADKVLDGGMHRNRVNVLKAVDQYPSKGQTDMLNLGGNVIGRNKDFLKGTPGRVKFVALPVNQTQEFLPEDDISKAVKMVMSKDGLSEGVVNKYSEVDFRLKFLKNACQRLVSSGQLAKADVLFKTGTERLIDHYTSHSRNQEERLEEDKELEKERLIVYDYLAERKNTLPSGVVDEKWFDKPYTSYEEEK